MFDLVYIGFGEAGAALAVPGAGAYDVKTADPLTRDDKRRDYASTGVWGFDNAPGALAGARYVFSLVTADRALAAAREYAPFIEPGTLWIDMNSVAPGTKRSAAEAVEAVGGRYVDAAIMAPVRPLRHAVPLLLAGPHAAATEKLLRKAGFSDIAVVGARIGDAASVKMIRSVLVKGIEALSAECALAAYAAGISDALMTSLEIGWRDQDWVARIDYNLDRMLVHGLRRAAEMEEVAKTLEDLGIDPVMTRGAIARHRAAGSVGTVSPEGLAAKLALIGARSKSGYP